MRWLIARTFIQRSLRHKERHDLLHQCTEDCGDHEQGIDHVLQTLLAGVCAVEREADEQSRGYAKTKLGQDI